MSETRIVLARPGVFEVSYGRGGKVVYITQHSIDYVESNLYEIYIHISGKTTPIMVTFNDKTAQHTSLMNILREISDTPPEYLDVIRNAMGRVADIQEGLKDSVEAIATKLLEFKDDIRNEFHTELTQSVEQLGGAINKRVTSLEEQSEITSLSSDESEEVVVKDTNTEFTISDTMIFLVALILVCVGLTSFAYAARRTM